REPDSGTPASPPAAPEASPPPPPGGADAAGPAAETAALPVEDSPFDRTAPPFEETGDAEPMLLAHDESPFEEPASIAAAIEIEQPMGVHIDVAPLAAEVPAELVFDEEAHPPAAPAEDLTNTLTMADLYARQGLTNEARHIYENILARDPANHDVREKLEAITPSVNPKIERLERWLSKVSKREVAGV
ncbi:MAG TPA: hypothetical protein VNI54_05525, partial [Thermoanaerobaculia bacterium]|nr:hypothetical protein [Thermoanaerobaculia bacterium]